MFELWFVIPRTSYSFLLAAEEMREPSIPSPVFITPSRSTRSQSAALLKRDDGDDGSANDDIKKEGNSI